MNERVYAIIKLADSGKRIAQRKTQVKEVLISVWTLQQITREFEPPLEMGNGFQVGETRKCFVARLVPIRDRLFGKPRSGVVLRGLP